jgi:Aerotolerance regulator N-terminal
MSFASPFILWGLLLIPVALIGYWLVQRRRIKYAARFTNLDLLANVVDASRVAGATFPPRSSSPHSPRSSSRWHGPRPSLRCPAMTRRSC